MSGRRPTLLCRCGRGVFSLAQIMVVNDDPSAFSPEGYRYVKCLKCGIDGIACMEYPRQEIAPLGTRRADEMVAAATADHKASLTKPVEPQPDKRCV